MGAILQHRAPISYYGQWPRAIAPESAGLEGSIDRYGGRDDRLSTTLPRDARHAL
jgi:hypothetical protein